MTTAADFRFRLDPYSGVPVYRQLMDQVSGAVASGILAPGAQLPTVRHVAVELAINLNTVLKAYREMEIRGVLDTQQGTGTFIAERPPAPDADERGRRLDLLVSEFVARAGVSGFSVRELIERLTELQPGAEKPENKKRRK